MSDAVKIEMIDPYAGRAATAMPLAVEELMRKGRNPQAYSVIASRAGRELTISFIDKNAPDNPNIEGGSGKHPGLEVVFDEPTMTIKKSYSIR